jgi:Beta-propeller repeat
MSGGPTDERWTRMKQYDPLSRLLVSVQNCRTSTGVPSATSCANYSASQRDRNIATQTAYDVLGRVLSTTENYVNGSFSASAPDEDIQTRTTYDGLGRALVYSTFLGGSGGDTSRGIALDGAGNAYIAGAADPGFPTTPGAYQTTTSTGASFIAKLNATLSALSYATYLEGAGLYGMTVNNAGEAYVTGVTEAGLGFPIVNPVQSSYGGGSQDAIVTKMNTAGSGLVYSTYLGGNSAEIGFGIAVDNAGNAYVTGTTNPSNFPSTSTLQAYAGSQDAFVTKISEATPPPTPPVPAARTIAYSYDGLLRLITATESPGNAFVYTYDNAANQMDRWQYDAAGNLLSDGASTYIYDALNRPITTTMWLQQRVASYNGDGTLVSQTACCSVSSRSTSSRRHNSFQCGTGSVALRRSARSA